MLQLDVHGTYGFPSRRQVVIANGLFAEQTTVRTPPSNVLEHCISNGRTKGRLTGVM